MLVAVLLAVALAGCGEAAPTPTKTPPSTLPTNTPTAAARVVTAGDTVSVHYHGTLDDGEVFDSSRTRDPFTFEAGAGQVIRGFEEAVLGRAVGEVVTVRIPPADAYGEHDARLVFEVERSAAPSALRVGDQVRLANGQPAVVLALHEGTIELDANHPLAGQALTFEIEIVSIE